MSYLYQRGNTKSLNENNILSPVIRHLVCEDDQNIYDLSVSTVNVAVTDCNGGCRCEYVPLLDVVPLSQADEVTVNVLCWSACSQNDGRFVKIDLGSYFDRLARLSRSSCCCIQTDR